MTEPDLDLAALRARLAELPPGRAVWRSLDAIAQTPRFRELLHGEYPAVTDLSTGPDRRSFLRLMAASLALSGLIGGTARADDRDQEVPFVNQPERVDPGAALYFASSTLLDGVANGILVTTRDGRPFKIEGNPQHPWSRGGTDIFAQASVLGPLRSTAFRRRALSSAAQQRGRHSAVLPSAFCRASGKRGQGPLPVDRTHHLAHRCCRRSAAMQ